MQRGLPQKRSIPGCSHVLVVSSGKGGVGKSSVAGEYPRAVVLLAQTDRAGPAKLRTPLHLANSSLTM